MPLPAPSLNRETVRVIERGVVVGTIKRLEHGLLGDVQPVGLERHCPKCEATKLRKSS